jgi:membrane protein DedA with SNARE-associated domain
VNRLAWPRFLLASAAGSLLWAVTVGTTGYVLGHEAHRLAGLFGVAALVLSLGILVVVGIFLHRHAAELTAAAERALPGPRAGAAGR